MVAGVAAAADDPLVISRTNETALNEWSGRLQSVVYDLRLSHPDADPGLGPMWPNAFLGITYRTRELFWAKNSALVQPPGAPFSPGAEIASEKRQETLLSYRQGLWTPWVWDAEFVLDAGFTSRSTSVTSSVSGTYEDTWMAADPRTIIRIPLHQERYGGLDLGLGATWGLGDTSDWIESHGGPGFVGQLNWSGTWDALPFFSFRTSVEYTAVPNAEQRVYTSNQNVLGSYEGWKCGAVVAWQVVRRLSIGGGASYESHDFHQLETESGMEVGDDTVVTSQVDGFVRYGIAPGCFLTGGIGIEAFTNTDQDRSATYTLSLEYAPW